MFEVLTSDFYSLLLIGTLVSKIPLHVPTQSRPVPHWVVLLAVVPILWFLIGATVMATDRLLRRYGV